MRVRVSFRYRTDTGEVEMFLVEDVKEGLPQSDHDARHDAATRDVARVVAPHPIVSEVLPGTTSHVAASFDAPAVEQPDRTSNVDGRLRD